MQCEVPEPKLSIFLAPFLQHELLQAGEHGEHRRGVGQPVVGQGLHQAGVDHPEAVGQALQGLHGVLVCQVIAGEYDSNVFLPVYPEGAPENVNGSRSLEMLCQTQFKIPGKTCTTTNLVPLNAGLGLSHIPSVRHSDPEAGLRDERPGAAQQSLLPVRLDRASLCPGLVVEGQHHTLGPDISRLGFLEI